MKHTRNIGIIAHIDAGKTTFTERVLFYTGKEHQIGAVDEGTATMDWMDEEKRRGITITSAATTCAWRDFRINIIDTPGHVDFTAEVERSLRVLDGAIVIFCGVGGVEAQSETVWHQADRYNVPRLAFINKLDRVGSDFYGVIREMRTKLKTNPLVVAIPLGKESELNGIIDLVAFKAVVFDQESEGRDYEVTDIPAELQAEAKHKRDEMIEALADQVEWLVEPYLAGKTIDEATLRKAIREVTLAYKMVPVFCGSALKNIGVQPVLDAVGYYLPSPLDIPPVAGKDPRNGKPLSRPHSPDESFSALAFKTATDRHGELTYLRVYSGKISEGMTVYNPRINKRERLNQIFLMHANERNQIKEARAGDIVAVIGLKETYTGDTLCEAKYPIVYEQLEFPEPVVAMAMEPILSADRDKLIETVQKLSKDDPTFQYKADEETGQLIVSGMGELHLEIIKNRMLADFKVRAKVSEPRVAYKEMITESIEAVGEFNRKIGEKMHYGYIRIRLEPSRQHLHPYIENQLPPKTMPDDFLKAVMDVLKTSALTGVKAGYPLIYLKITILGAGEKRSESSEVGYSAAAGFAFRDALAKTDCVILEPIMKLEVVTPENYLGDVINNLGQRRAEISGIETIHQRSIIKGTIPIAETFGYATVLRSLTQGRGSYSLEPYDYKPTKAV